MRPLGVSVSSVNIQKFSLCFSLSLFFSLSMSMWRIWRSLRPAALLEKRLWNRCFPVNFTKFLRTPFFIEHHRTTVSVFYRVGWIFMESSHPGRWGGQLYRALGDLKFSSNLGGGLSQMRGLKFFTLLREGQQAILFWGNGGCPSHTGQKFAHHSPMRKSLPVDSQFLI